MWLILSNLMLLVIAVLMGWSVISGSKIETRTCLTLLMCAILMHEIASHEMYIR